jgi:hypothetical protein
MIGVVTCIGLMAFLGRTAWIIGLAGLGTGIGVYILMKREKYRDLINGVRI